MESMQALEEQIGRLSRRESLSIWWLGQAGFALGLGGKCLYIDPFFSQIPGRLTRPPFPAERALDVDYVLGTHDHVDHIDRQAWPRLAAASPRAKFLLPQSCVTAVAEDMALFRERLIGMSGESRFAEDGLEIYAIPAAHEQLEREAETGEYISLGYVIQGGGFTVYHSGDCCIYEGLRAALARFGRLDLMLLPINGRSGAKLRNGIIGNMTYQEAVDLAGVLEPRLVLPMHFDAFSGNTEDPALFLDYLQMKYPRVTGRIPAVGERIELLKEAEDEK